MGTFVGFFNFNTRGVKWGQEWLWKLKFYNFFVRSGGHIDAWKHYLVVNLFPDLLGNLLLTELSWR